MDYFLFLGVTGLATGFVYALLAIGFVVVYKGTRVLNFAQGSLVMLGGYFCFIFLAQLGIHPFIGFPLALGMAVVTGLLIERLSLRPLIGKRLLSLVMVTIGLSSIIEGLVIAIWGTDERALPKLLPEIPLSLGSVSIPSAYVWAFIVTGILISALFLFFKFANLGIVMRAVSNNQPAALSMGISVSKIFAVSWILASLIATAGGYILCNITMLSPASAVVIYPLFAAVIIGGLDSIPGALIGASAIGVIQNLTAGYLGHLTGASFKVVVPFIVLLLVLMLKPYGLFGTKEIERL